VSARDPRTTTTGWTAPDDASTAGDAPAETSGRRVRRAHRRLALVLTYVAVAAIAIAVALTVAPDSTVTAFGQTVNVGTAPPSLSLEGPGELVLFGQSVPTAVQFLGPIRPRVVLTTIDLNQQVAASFAPGPHAAVASTLGPKLIAGWRNYFFVEIGLVTLVALVLLGAIAGWRRLPVRATLVFAVIGLLVAEVLNLGAIGLAAATVPARLRNVESLQQLVGQTAAPPLAPAAGPAQPQVQAVVLGDSTAAGLGGPIVSHPTKRDTACGRSSFSFATTLERVNDWTVENLACSGATIDSGVLRAQTIGGTRVPAQLAVAKRAVDASTVIVAIGANDLGWSSFLRLCAVVDTCNNRAVDAYFQRSLETFTRSYLELLRQLSTFPGAPQIVVVQYYLPFDPAQDCLAGMGLTTEKMTVLVDRLRALNDVLATGAATFGYATAAPDFAGHELCTEQPYVQGPLDPAPMHPNARGELLIALAVERAILDTA
jgi:lysophospholipase L1-like esterase